MRRWLIWGGGAAVVVVALLLFRPDTLFTEVAVDESLEEAFVSTTAADAASTTITSTTTTTATATSVASPSTTSSLSEPEPVALSTGQFVGIDHRAAGTARVYEQDAQHVLRLEEDTDIQNGPDLWVWLLPAESYDGGVPSDYIDLGTLKGTVGSQNYPLPADFDPELHRVVLIWCLRFQVPFAAAPLG